MIIGSYTLILTCDCPDHRTANDPQFYAGRDEVRARQAARADGWRFGQTGFMTCPSCKRRGLSPALMTDPLSAVAELLRRVETHERPR